MNLCFAQFCLIVLLPNSMSKLSHNRCKPMHQSFECKMQAQNQSNRRIKCRHRIKATSCSGLFGQAVEIKATSCSGLFGQAVDERRRNNLYDVQSWVHIFSGSFGSVVNKRTSLVRQWRKNEKERRPSQRSRLVCNWWMVKSGPVFCSLARVATRRTSLLKRLRS